jgi:hypothetical protein
MTLIKMMRFQQVFLFYKSGIFGKYLRAHMAPDGIIDRVANNAGQQQREHHFKITHQAGPCHNAGCEEQGIPRKKRRYNQAGFTKNNDEQDGVNPQAILVHQFKKMDIDIEDKIPGIGYPSPELIKKFHEGSP